MCSPYVNEDIRNVPYGILIPLKVYFVKLTSNKISENTLNQIRREFSGNIIKQDSIPVGCILATCQLHVFQWLPLGVSTVWG